MGAADNSTLPELITFEEIATKLGMTIRTLKTRVATGGHPHIHIGNGRWMNREQFDAFLASNTKAESPADPLASVRNRRRQRATRTARTAARPAA